MPHLHKATRAFLKDKLSAEDLAAVVAMPTVDEAKEFLRGKLTDADFAELHPEEIDGSGDETEIDVSGQTLDQSVSKLEGPVFDAVVAAVRDAVLVEMQVMAEMLGDQLRILAETHGGQVAELRFQINALGTSDATALKTRLDTLEMKLRGMI